MSPARQNPTHHVVDNGLKGWRYIPTPKPRVNGHEIDVAPPEFDRDAAYEIEPVAGQSPLEGITDLLGGFHVTTG